MRICAIGIDLSPIPSVGLCVCVCVRWPVCPESVLGKTAEWIRMLFGMVSGVGRLMGILDGGGERQRGRGSFG